MHDWDVGDYALNTWIRFRQANEAILKSVETELESYQTSLPQVDILSILNASEQSLTPSEIASYTFRELHSTSELLTRMEKQGYIKRIRDESDRRFVRVGLQPKGKKLLDKIIQSGFAEGRRIMKEALTVEEIQELDRMLIKLRNVALRDFSMQPSPLPETMHSKNMVYRDVPPLTASQS